MAPDEDPIGQALASIRLRPGGEVENRRSQRDFGYLASSATMFPLRSLPAMASRVGRLGTVTFEFTLAPASQMHLQLRHSAAAVRDVGNCHKRRIGTQIRQADETLAMDLFKAEVGTFSCLPTAR